MDREEIYRNIDIIRQRHEEAMMKEMKPLLALLNALPHEPLIIPEHIARTLLGSGENKLRSVDDGYDSTAIQKASADGIDDFMERSDKAIEMMNSASPKDE